MEIIMISDSKLKVMLTKEDLEDFDIETEELDYGNTETKRMFWDILSRAKHTVGFDTDGHRVLVQLFSSRAGGCEMFITKIGSVCPPCQSKEDPNEDGDLHPILHYKPSYRSVSERGKTGAFGFDCLPHLLTVCRRLIGIGYGGNSSAYIGDDKRYYLFLDGLDPTGYLPIDEYSFIAEYGSTENIDAITGFLHEHGKAICDDRAVEQLGVL